MASVTRALRTVSFISHDGSCIAGSRRQTGIAFEAMRSVSVDTDHLQAATHGWMKALRCGVPKVVVLALVLIYFNTRLSQSQARHHAALVLPLL